MKFNETFNEVLGTIALSQEKAIGTPLQYSCLENPMDSRAWQAAVHGVVKSDTTEQLAFHFSLSCIGEGNGNPLQCSCLEHPRDGGARLGCRLWGHTESDTTEAIQQQQQVMLQQPVAAKAQCLYIIRFLSRSGCCHSMKYDPTVQTAWNLWHLDIKT